MIRIIDLSAMAGGVDGAVPEAPGVEWNRPDPWCAVPDKRPSPNLFIDFCGSAFVAAVIGWVVVIAFAKLFGVYH